MGQRKGKDKGSWKGETKGRNGLGGKERRIKGGGEGGISFPRSFPRVYAYASEC